MANPTVYTPAPLPEGVGLQPRAGRPGRKRAGFGFLKVLACTALTMFGLLGLFLAWFFLTPSGTSYRNVAADTIISTQHRTWARFLIGQSELNRRVQAYSDRFDEYAKPEIQQKASIPAAVPDKKPLLEVVPVSGKGFKGYLLKVSDPTKIRLAVPGKFGMGEKVSEMVKRTGALAGVNGGGFIDPEWKGNGFQPIGIVMSGGKIFYNDTEPDMANHIVGIDKSGQMIAGKYSARELQRMGVSEAVTFAPRFIVNGVGQIKNEADGWGIAPRTCMAQTKDGTIIFAIIDGRQPGYSIGATLYDVQQILLQHGAIIAANLDGGASTVLVKDNRIINRPSSKYGERYLPTAFLVYEDPAKADIRNIWEGIDISTIDPRKWKK